MLAKSLPSLLFPLSLLWEGPDIVTLSPPMAVKVIRNDSWIHHLRVKVWPLVVTEEGQDQEGNPATLDQSNQLSCEPLGDLKLLFQKAPRTPLAFSCLGN